MAAVGASSAILRVCCALLLIAQCSASRVSVVRSTVAVSRRGALVGAAAAVLQGTNAAIAIDAVAAKKDLLSTSADLRAFLKQKEVVLEALDKGDQTVKLPASIPFKTFQALEKDAGPEFMEIAIDYAEAARNARDLLKLAQLTTETVTVSVKEAGQPRKSEVKTMRDASNLAPTSEYAGRMMAEVLGASVALDAAIQAMVSP